MSNRTLVELNHDFCPPDRLLDVWAKQMQEYMRSGDRAELPYGVTFKHMRHHSEPCPLEPRDSKGAREMSQKGKS